MVRANSLLYALYVCLIVALLCGALLYIANLYNQLNLFYTTREELYIHNQSLVNYALSNPAQSTMGDDEESPIHSFYEIKQYGLLKVLTASSILKNDTVVSLHFAAADKNDPTCIYMANRSFPLAYSGTVKLIGDKMLPVDYMRPVHIENKANILEQKGETRISEYNLPELGKHLKGVFSTLSGTPLTLEKTVRGDSLYSNSFSKPCVDLHLSGSVLANVRIKGNVIISAADSVIIRSTAYLDDVIIRAPKIYFEERFNGSVQAFASQKIVVGKDVMLNYPSVLCVNNASAEPGSIYIDEESRVCGAIILFGNAEEHIDKNKVEISKGALIIADVYSTGIVNLKSNIYGSVYANKFVHTTASSGYDNCIADVEINPGRRPASFIPIPLFDTNKNYETLKKVL